MLLIKIKNFVDNEEGATVIEYALIGAIVSIALILGLRSVGGSLSTQFTEISQALDGNISFPPQGSSSSAG